MINKSQIWVETAVYTLIGLVIIGIVIAVITPAISKYKDKMIIEQSISLLNDFNQKIVDVKEAGIGNRRIVPELSIKKGSFEINCPENKIEYILRESSLEYSQEGKEIISGNIKIKTEKIGKKYNIFLTLTYQDLNLFYNGKIERKEFASASTPYKFFIENNGTSGEKIQIILGEIS